MSTFDTEDGRLAAAEAAGRAVAYFEIRNGHTTPRENWDRDGDHNAGAYSHLAAVGFTRLGCRTYSLPFINAYLQVYATGK